MLETIALSKGKTISIINSSKKNKQLGLLANTDITIAVR
jgi:hypothetical protein